MPTVENFKALLRMNAIQICPVTVKDMKIAEHIFGPDMSSLKGMSTRSKPKPLRKDLVEIPAEITEKHHDIELCMDTMFVNKCGMLTGIDRSIRFRSVVPIDTKTLDDYYEALDIIFHQYNKGGFVIKTIYCDGEYRAMMNKVSDNLDVVMNYTNAMSGGSSSRVTEMHHPGCTPCKRGSLHSSRYAIGSGQRVPISGAPVFIYG